MPEGADTIVIQEDVQREGGRIRLAAAARAGDNLRAIGMDFREGDTLIAAGRRLTPRDVALAAAANHVALTVRRRARVAILATGDELVAPGGTTGPAQIIASNNFAVAGVVEACGGVPIDLGIAIDEIGALDAAIGQAVSAKADVLVTLGGASVGDYDLVQKALVGAGMELGFWRIAMRPGKPLMQGRLGPMRVLGLPGNPTSSMVCATLFLRPLLRALHGEPDPGADPSGPARLAVDLPANGQRQDYMRASLSRGEDGILIATPAGSQDFVSGQNDGARRRLIVRAPHAEPARAGDACRVIAFDGLGIPFRASVGAQARAYLEARPRWPVGLQRPEQEGGRETEQHHSVERLQGAHQLPVLGEENVGVAVGGHRAQRIEHGGREIGPSAEREVRRKPRRTPRAREALSRAARLRRR